MSAEPRRCFLHVGAPKTGTSYLQSVLWASRPAMSAQGLELPLRQVDHFRLTLALRGRVDEAMDGLQAVNVLDRLGEAVRSSSADRLLISHELLAPVTAERAQQLHDLLADYEVHIVITARDVARQIPAEWQQSIKHRASHTYEEFMSAVVEHRAEHFWAVQDVADVARRWRAALPPERVHIVTVPQRNGPPGALLERFCSVLGVETTALATDAATANPSMGAQQAELLRRVNVALGHRLPHPRAGYARVAKNHLGDRVLAVQEGEPLRLPRRLDGWAHDAARDMVARIRAEGYSVVGDLEDLIPAATRGPESGDADNDGGADVPEAAVTAAAVEAIAALLDQRHRDLEELGALRAAARRGLPPGRLNGSDATAGTSLRAGAGTAVRRVGSVWGRLRDRAGRPSS